MESTDKFCDGINLNTLAIEYHRPRRLLLDYVCAFLVFEIRVLSDAIVSHQIALK